MKRSVELWQSAGFAFTSIGGTLLHFLYEWTDKAVFVAPFSAVNESTWEHMKLLFWPMFIFAIVQSFFFRDRADFWKAKLKGILAGLLLIPLLFYTYNGAIGKSPSLLNILLFFVSAAAAYLCETKQLSGKAGAHKATNLAFFSLCFIALLFVLFTFDAPELGIFRDPLTGDYGLSSTAEST